MTPEELNDIKTAAYLRGMADIMECYEGPELINQFQFQFGYLLSPEGCKSWELVKAELLEKIKI